MELMRQFSPSPSSKSPQILRPNNQWDSEKLYFDGDSFFQSLCNDIKIAQHSIYIETYLFSNDSLGRKIVRLLMEASKRGVEVKVIVDGFGSPFWRRTFQKQLKKNGIEFKTFRPISFHLALISPCFSKAFQTLQTQLARRNHRKLFIFDEKIAYTGSMNIAAYHLKEYANENAWRDTGARVTGPEVALLVNAFFSSWSPLRLFNKNSSELSQNVRVYSNRKAKHALYRDFLMRIDGSQKAIWLTTAYFVPTGRLLKKLASAAKRGVDIRILTTTKTDVYLVRWMRSAFYLGLLDAGARIFEYQPSVLHAKCALIDEFAMVGSTNLNNRSFFHDLEVDVVLTDPQSHFQLRQQFRKDINLSREILKENFIAENGFEMRLAKFALFFRKWL